MAKDLSKIAKQRTGLILGGGFGANELANPTSSIMAINLNDHINGVFWAAFLLFSWTAASIVSGALDLVLEPLFAVET